MNAKPIVSELRNFKKFKILLAIIVNFYYLDFVGIIDEKTKSLMSKFYA